MQPTTAEYAQMSWHARRRLAHRLKLARRVAIAKAIESGPRRAAQRHLDSTPLDPPEVVADRLAVLKSDYDHRGQRHD